MKILNKANEFIIDIIKNQQFNENKKYIESPYIIKKDNMWYNGLTNEAVFIEDFNKDKKELVEKYFYFSTNFNIQETLNKIEEKYSYIKESFLLQKRTFIIFTTTECNANCSYCFEKGIKRKTMDEKTSLDVANYILNKSQTINKPIKLMWFGGEPLVNKKSMNIICNKLQQENKKYYATLITNGFLFNKVTDDQIKLWNLNNVQFTIDNIGEKYDNIKGLPNGAYNKLKQTIHRLQNLNIKVSIRLHIDSDNNDISICKKIANEFQGYKNIYIYGRLLYDKKTSIESYKKLLELEEYLNSYYDFDDYTFPYHCIADNRQVACITPEGNLTYCQHYPNQNLYGNIYSYKFDKKLFNEWNTLIKNTKKSCKKCPFYPLCTLLVNCPTKGDCENGYLYYQIEIIKKAMQQRKEQYGYIITI